MLPWNEAEALLNEANSVLIVTHVNPDGDAIGSMLGLMYAIKARGKQVDCAVDGGVPAFLRFLSGSDQIRARLDAGEWDLLIFTDCGDDDRAGDVGEYGKAHVKRILNIDHHITNTRFGDVALVMTDATSAAEVVFRWLRETGQTLGESAQPLLTGLVTDTRGFRISSVKPDTLAIAGELMAAGASLYRVFANTLDSQTPETFRLWQVVLPRAVFDRRLVYVTITLDDWAAAGLEDYDDGGMGNYLLSVNGVHASAIFKQTGAEEVKLSMRSKPGTDVSAVALPLGGGGHVQAAGATINATPDAALDKVLPLLYSALDLD